MRILEVGKFYPPEHGGMETALREICRGLSERGHQVYALVAASRAASSTERVDGVTVHRVACLGRLRSLPIVPGLGLALARTLRTQDPDVVHVHLPNPSAVLAWRLAGDGRPVVVTYHSDIVRQRWLARLWAPWRRGILTGCARIVTTSESMVDTSPALRPLRAKCVVLPLAIDTKPFAAVDPAAVQAVRADLGGEFVLFTGRMVYYKGLDILLQAVEDTELRLVLAGDGPLRASLERQVRRRGLSGQVRFVGDVSDERLRVLYHASTALVLPSTAPSEAFGLVQLEAMACGKPVVASRASGGVASVQDDGVTGLLVPPANVPALREALLALWREPARARQMGEAGRARVRSHYDSAARAARLEEVLATAVGYARDKGRSTTP